MRGIIVIRAKTFDLLNEKAGPSLSSNTTLTQRRFGAIFASLLVLISLALPFMAQAQAPAQATTVQLPGEARQPTASVSSYLINPGDVIEIFVWGEERLQRELTVLPDGTIAFPLVGQLQVEGKLPQEVEQQVSERLRSQYRGEVPFVTVSVKAPAGMRFSILGRVRSPGVFDMKQYLTVLEALSRAGGPDEFANVDNISVIRQDGATTQTYRVRLGGLLKGGTSQRELDNAGLVTIEPGDVIIVP